MKRFIVLGLLLFTTPAYAADALVFAVDKPAHENAEEDRQGRSKKGYVINCFEDGRITSENSDTFVLVRIPAITLEQCEGYTETYEQNFDWSVQTYNQALDGYRLNVFVSNPDVSGHASITRSQVETYLEKWGGAVVSASANNVQFDIGVYQIATSAAFWEQNSVATVTFAELDYNTTTGIHRVSATHPLDDADATSRVEQRGGVVVSSAGGVIVFDLDRTVAIDAFKQDVKRAMQKVVWERELYLDPAWIDTITASGGEIIATPAEVISHVLDRTNE